MAKYEFTQKHINEISAEFDITEDEVIGWFPSTTSNKKPLAYSQKAIRDRLENPTTPTGKPRGIQETIAEEILEILASRNFIRNLSWLSVGNDGQVPPHVYNVEFPSETTKKDIERLSLKDSLTGFYRLTRRKVSDAEVGKNFVVEYLDITPTEDDIHFTLYAICNNYGKPITFTGAVRKLGGILLLAGKRTPDDNSTLSFKMLYMNDEGSRHVEKSRARWGLMTTKTLMSEEENPVSTRVLFEKTHSGKPSPQPEPSFQDMQYIKETYLGSYSKDHPLYDAVVGLISNNIKKHPATIGRPNIEAVPELGLGVSQTTIDYITPFLVRNMGDLREDK